MNIPKISVIVPVYNVEKYLHRCIDSILTQTFTDFELLLIDDGSKDNSGKICDEYAEKDKRIRVFHKENGGVSSARNLGLDNAGGEWICFADSDDWVKNNWLEIFSKSFNHGDLIISGYYEVKNNTIIREKGVFNQPSLLSTVSILEKKNIFGYLWCKCFKRSIINKYQIRFGLKYRIWEDVEFIYSYMQRINTVF